MFPNVVWIGSVSLMTALANRVGPHRIWNTLKGKKVKTNDGKDLGEIKEVSQNHFHMEKGTIHKESFWIPKYVADAFDGKILWLILSEEEVRGRYQFGQEPPAEERYASEFEGFKVTPYGQKISYRPDFNENIRVVENYNNIRDLGSRTTSAENKGEHLETILDGYSLTSGPVKEQIDEQKKVKDKKENENS
jgi:hypothetical protein